MIIRISRSHHCHLFKAAFQGQRGRIEHNNMQNSHSDGSDLIGSNTAEAEDAADPSNEAEDCSCWVTVADVSVVGASGMVLVTSEINVKYEMKYKS